LGEQEPERAVRVGLRRAVFPTNRLTKYQRYLARAAQKALLSGAPSEFRRAGQACSSHGIGCHHQVVVADAGDLAVLFERHLTCSSVDLLHGAVEPDL